MRIKGVGPLSEAKLAPMFHCFPGGQKRRDGQREGNRSSTLFYRFMVRGGNLFYRSMCGGGALRVSGKRTGTGGARRAPPTIGSDCSGEHIRQHGRDRDRQENVGEGYRKRESRSG